jgi:Zn-dependent M16 (insulinase) family peptidase
VYHVNEEGEDSGVVYSEMQSLENEDENIVERAMYRALYPDANCGYRYETGGVLHNLRTSCSHQKVIDYHNKMYRPDNVAIVVAGQIDDAEIIQVLAKFEEKMLSKVLN